MIVKTPTQCVVRTVVYTIHWKLYIAYLLYLVKCPIKTPSATKYTRLCFQDPTIAVIARLQISACLCIWMIVIIISIVIIVIISVIIIHHLHQLYVSARCICCLGYHHQLYAVCIWFCRMNILGYQSDKLWMNEEGNNFANCVAVFSKREQEQ